MATLPDQLLKELADKLAAIEASDASAAGPHWGAMHKLLLKMQLLLLNKLVQMQLLQLKLLVKLL
jgi:hypothetical protein